MKAGKWTIFLCLALGVVWGCFEPDPEPASTVTTVDQLIWKDEILSAPAVERIGGKDLMLEANAWRNFMPPIPEGGNPLIVLIYVKTVDSSPFPAGVTAEKLYVIQGTQVWLTDFSGESRPVQPDSQIEEVARNGPKWEPSSLVDIAVRLRDAQGNVWFLRVLDQPIGAPC